MYRLSSRVVAIDYNLYRVIDRVVQSYKTYTFLVYGYLPMPLTYVRALLESLSAHLS